MDRFVSSGAKVVALDVIKLDIANADCQQCDLGDVDAIKAFEDYIQKQ